MTENPPTPTPENAPPKPEVVIKYPAMVFVSKFSRLVATVMAFAFVGFALYFIFLGIFSSKVPFVLGIINAGFYLLIGSVCIGLVRGAGEVFELLLDLEKRK